jgi:hypothetical protein
MIHPHLFSAAYMGSQNGGRRHSQADEQNLTYHEKMPRLWRTQLGGVVWRGPIKFLAHTSVIKIAAALHRLMFERVRGSRRLQQTCASDKKRPSNSEAVGSSMVGLPRHASCRSRQQKAIDVSLCAIVQLLPLVGTQKLERHTGIQSHTKRPLVVVAPIPATYNYGLTGRSMISRVAEAGEEIGAAVVWKMPNQLPTDLHRDGVLAVRIVGLRNKQCSAIVMSARLRPTASKGRQKVLVMVRADDGKGKFAVANNHAALLGAVKQLAKPSHNSSSNNQAPNLAPNSYNFHLHWRSKQYLAFSLRQCSVEFEAMPPPLTHSLKKMCPWAAELTPRERRFVEEHIIDLNGQQAYSCGARPARELKAPQGRLLLV